MWKLKKVLSMVSNPKICHTLREWKAIMYSRMSDKLYHVGLEPPSFAEREDIANYKSLSYVGKGFQLLWNAIDFKLQWKNRESWCFPNLESKSRVNNNFNCYRIATIGSKIKKTTTLKMYFEGFL